MSHVQSNLGNGRYHYNVSGSRLEVHVRKGYDDGLYISSVASAEGLWAVIMDAGTRFCQQCYHIAPASFLPKAWIMEKWDLGFYITAIAGAHVDFLRIIAALLILPNRVQGSRQWHQLQGKDLMNRLNRISCHFQPFVLHMLIVASKLVWMHNITCASIPMNVML